MGIGFGLVAFAPVCLGGSVKATEENPDPSVFSTGGFLNVAAFSEELGVTNHMVTPSVFLGGMEAMSPGQYKSGVGLTSQTIFVPDGGMKLNLSGTRMIPTGSFLGPVAQIVGPNGLALNKNQLTNVGDEVNINSTTDEYTGIGAVENTSIIGKGKYQVSAQAIAGDTEPGSAAALAGDPVDIPSGTYTYDPDITAEVDIDAGEAGEAQVYAVDASTFTTDSVDNYDADGEPLQDALWSLVISSNTPSDTSNNVSVDFELNPAALNEITLPSSYVTLLGSFSTPAQEAALIDLADDLSITGDMSIVGDDDVLSDMDPFPSGDFHAHDGRRGILRRSRCWN